MPPEGSRCSIDLRGRVACVTGGTGALGLVIAQALAEAGAQVAVLGRDTERLARAEASLRARQPAALAVAADVCDPTTLSRAHERIRQALGPVTILVNAAGGNRPQATTGPDRTFFSLDPGALEEVIRLNLLGTIWACQAFGRDMVEVGHGSIVNIASVAALRPLSRVVGYGAAKAGIVNFTQWLAVHLAREYSPAIRVNAIVPGFFLTEQNRFLLLDEQAPDGLSERGRAVLARTPLGRFGHPEDLCGLVLWLVGDSAQFTTGAVIPVDGGFLSEGGV
jgi:NAD(P)-dependent dehydrogenase (short-subunit alcohol dehydrogenase family)